MAIGTTIRTEGSPIANQVFANAHGRPMIIPAKYRFPRTNRDE